MESAIQTYEDMVKEVRNQLISQEAFPALVHLAPPWVAGAICV